MTILFFMRYRSSIMPPSPYPTPERKDASEEHRKMKERKRKKKEEEDFILKFLQDYLDKE